MEQEWVSWTKNDYYSSSVQLQPQKDQAHWNNKLWFFIFHCLSTKALWTSACILWGKKQIFFFKLWILKSHDGKEKKLEIP